MASIITYAIQAGERKLIASSPVPLVITIANAGPGTVVLTTVDPNVYNCAANPNDYVPAHSSMVVGYQDMVNHLWLINCDDKPADGALIIESAYSTQSQAPIQSPPIVTTSSAPSVVTPPAGDVHLISASATFDTTTNDKDHDTLLDITVLNNQGVVAFNKTGVGGHWNDHSTSVVSLDLKNALRKSEISSGAVRLDIHPNGNDKWEFNYHVNLSFSDNSMAEHRFDGKVLTQDNPTAQDPF